MKNRNIFVIIMAIMVIMAVYFIYVLLPSQKDNNYEQTKYENFTLPGIFSLKYPAGYKIETGNGLGGGFLDNTLAKISLPKGQFGEEETKTNYVESYLVLSSSENSQYIASCRDFSDLNNAEKKDQKNINGQEFQSVETKGAAAGNLYDSRVYRILRGNACYEIALTVHTGNIGNYPEGSVAEFDKNKAFAALEQILDSIKFEK